MEWRGSGITSVSAMKHIWKISSLFFLANLAGMVVSCVGLKKPEVAGDVNILNVGSVPDATAAYLTARTDNADAVSCCGFFWGRETPENRVEAELLQDGSFGSMISGLEPGTSFVFCAFIGNGIDEKRSESLYFKTTAVKEGDPEDPHEPGQPDDPGIPRGPVVIPDRNFRSILLQRFDADSDGELSDFEIGSVQNLHITDDSVESVEGIERFRALVSFHISGENDRFGYYPSGNLTSLDLSRNPKLREVEITHEKLAGIDISGNPELVHLGLFSCPISSIDLTGADRLELFGAGYCKLDNLTVKGLKALNEVHLDHNVLTELRLENLPELHYLDCSGNRLKTLDLSGCPKLEDLDCSGNPDLETVFLKKDHKMNTFRRDEGVKIVYLN